VSPRQWQLREIQSITTVVHGRHQAAEDVISQPFPRAGPFNRSGHVDFPPREPAAASTNAGTLALAQRTDIS
jgi:hypothetical protein